MNIGYRSIAQAYDGYPNITAAEELAAAEFEDDVKSAADILTHRFPTIPDIASIARYIVAHGFRADR